MTPPDYTLYLVTDHPSRYRGAALIESVMAAVSGGARVVQYRAAGLTHRERYDTALALGRRLRTAGVPLIINDHIDLALAVEADGVHIGQNDLPPAVARRLLGPDRLLGLSITDEAQLAAVDPKVVDYLGIGPVFPTGSKDDAAPALGLARLAAMTAATALPVVAIGGINLDNASSVFRSGVAGVAVVSALSLSSDPAESARLLRNTHPR